MKRSSIVEHLINSFNCGKNYYKAKFRIIRKGTNLFDLIKLEVILIHLYTMKLNKHRVFDYTVSLFN